MERAEWLKRMRQKAEGLYDHLAPAYWVTFGFYANTTHCQFIEKLLGSLKPNSSILDAACGAGRYDEILLGAGHSVLGIDQSEGMLVRARERFPQERFPRLRYARVGLQEMDFQAEFDGAVCIDSLETIPPEDWPGVLAGFQKSLKPGGLLYFTVEVTEQEEIQEAYERALAHGLPVVYGEIADTVDVRYDQTLKTDWSSTVDDLLAPAVYHYYPSPEQLRGWLAQAELRVVEQGTGNEYDHYLVQKSG